MTSNFKVDILVKTFKDLQQEKSCLEQKLKELREKRKRIENEDEAASSRLGQVKEVYAKMSEVQKVSQHKVMQTQSQLNQLEAMNTKKRKILKDWNRQIMQERETRIQERVLFEKELNDLSVTFLEAKNFYTPDNLQEQISKELGTQRLYDIEMNNEQRQIELMTDRLQEMLLKNAHEEIAVTKQEQKSVMEALLKERRLLEERYKQQQTELAQMNNHYKTLESELKAI